MWLIKLTCVLGDHTLNFIPIGVLTSAWQPKRILVVVAMIKLHQLSYPNVVNKVNLFVLENCKQNLSLFSPIISL